MSKLVDTRTNASPRTDRLLPTNHLTELFYYKKIYIMVDWGII